MRFHVVSLPHTQTTKQYLHCAYTQKVLNFCRMMKGLGHTVYLYASEDNEALCDELIPCITKQEQKTLIGIERPEDNLKAEFDADKPYWKLMNKRVVVEIQKRKKDKDFLCVIAGICQKPIADAMPDMMTVEYGIGYSGVFAPYRVFESYAWMHTVYGSLAGDASRADGRFFDAVIPNYYNVADFPFSDKKDDYFLFIGRLIDRKGYQIAVEVCKRLGKRLVVAGQGTAPDGVDYRGVVGVKERGELMSKAQAVFVPTLYIEPFGGVSVEAMLCGTPVITTDWGAFTETVKQGETGFRCRTLQEFIHAAKQVSSLDYQKIRAYAIQRFSLETVAKQYEEYFARLSTLWSDGWYFLDKTEKL